MHDVRGKFNRNLELRYQISKKLTTESISETPAIDKAVTALVRSFAVT